MNYWSKEQYTSICWWYSGSLSSHLVSPRGNEGILLSFPRISLGPYWHDFWWLQFSILLLLVLWDSISHGIYWYILPKWQSGQSFLSCPSSSTGSGSDRVWKQGHGPCSIRCSASSVPPVYHNQYHNSTFVDDNGVVDYRDQILGAIDNS
jgi:hypothetical protein